MTVLGATLLVAMAIRVAPADAKLADTDTITLAQMALEWAVGGGISDFKLVKDPANLIVANSNLPKNAKLQLPGRTVTVFPPLRIQAEADFKGDFLYFRFNSLKGDKQRASVVIALVWAVSRNSQTQYLSGGGATLDFERRDGKWQLLPVTNMWMS